MKGNRIMLVFAGALLLFLSSLPSPAADVFLARIHYLGHAAFVIEFANGVTVLTDYGQSMAYGLNSPIHGLGDLQPDVVTISHGHADHAGGKIPAGSGIVLRDGQSVDLKGLAITAIPTFEQSLDQPDNFAYLFTFRGLTILHAGDCQALIKNVHTPQGRSLARQTYPGTVDLLLLPIGYIDDIIEPAIDFLELLHPRRAVPMHYWNPQSKETFLQKLEEWNVTRRQQFAIERSNAGRLTLFSPQNNGSRITIYSLPPEPYTGSK